MARLMVGVLVNATTGPAKFLVVLALALPTLLAVSVCEAVTSTLPWARLVTFCVTVQVPALQVGLGLMAMLPMATVTSRPASLQVPLTV